MFVYYYSCYSNLTKMNNKTIDYEEEILNLYITEYCNDSINYDDFIKKIKISDTIYQYYINNDQKSMINFLLNELKKEKFAPYYTIFNTKNQKITKVKLNGEWKTFYHDSDIKEIIEPLIKKIKIWISICK
jgi:hypothetical protein